jgi:hypothetical protein
MNSDTRVVHDYAWSDPITYLMGIERRELEW